MKKIISLLMMLIIAMQLSAQINFPTPTVANPICYYDTVGSITASGVTGGINPYTYSINGGAYSTNNLFTSLVPGVYTITVKDNSTIPIIAHQIVSIVLPPIIAISSVTPAGPGCCTQSFNFTVSGGTAPYLFSSSGQFYNPINNYSQIFVPGGDPNCNLPNTSLGFLIDGIGCFLSIEQALTNGGQSVYGGLGFPQTPTGGIVSNATSPSFNNGKITFPPNSFNGTLPNMQNTNNYNITINGSTNQNGEFEFTNLSSGIYVVNNCRGLMNGMSTCCSQATYTVSTVASIPPFICGTDSIFPTYATIATGGTTINSSAVPLPATMSSQTILVDANGTLNIDVNTNWTNCKIVLLDDASITVASGVTFNATACEFKGCNKLWKGINVLSGGAFNASQCVFKDAKVAVEFSVGNAASIINGNSFINNFLGIFRRGTAPSNFPVTIVSNNFSNASITGSLKPAVGLLNPNTTYDASLGILSTTFNTHSYAGIYIKYATTISANIDNNNFTEMNNGVVLKYCRVTTLTNNKFLNIKRKYTTGTVFGIGIFNDSWSINNNLLSVIGSTLPATFEFNNCDNGIKNSGCNLEVKQNEFYNTKYSCVYNTSLFNLRNGITVDSNIMKSFTDYGIYTKWTVGAQTPIVRIRENSITMNTSIASVPIKTAIYIEGASAFGTNPFLAASNSTIFNNNITLPNSALSKTGIFVKWMKESRIINNKININGALNSVGIDLVQLTNNNTSCNLINCPIPTTPLSTIGIRVTSSNTELLATSIIRCNRINKMRRCILFNGLITTPIAVVANQMMDGVQGIEIGSTANIGNQVLTGNSWSGSAWLASTGKLLSTVPGLTFTCSGGSLSPAPLVSAGVLIPSTSASANCQNAPQCAGILFKKEEEENIDVFTPTEIITVYPNPANDYINIKNILSEKSSDIFIYNLQGKLILQTPTIAEYQNIKIDILAPGTYIIKVIVNNESIIKKFVKQ